MGTEAYSLFTVDKLLSQVGVREECSVCMVLSVYGVVRLCLCVCRW